MTHNTNELKAWIFDIQRFTVHDGPGVRTTVFLQGCPLRCAWCQNPESQSPGAHLMYYADLCIACGACREVCSNGLDPGLCTACGACAKVCPTEARRIAGRRMSIDEVLDQALRDRAFYGDQGGVTFSGGEPLSQWPFVHEAARRLRAEGVHTVIDTCGCATRDVVAAVPDAIDLAIVDFKLYSVDRHRRWTGADNAGILDAIAHWAREMPGRLWISLPLIPGVQDAAELERIASYLADLDPTPPVRLIPYHRLGEGKYAALGLSAPQFEGDVDAMVELARGILSARGVPHLDG